ncbi:MAG: hypothetical protein WCR07_00890 [Verrucomicrobiota bacterium]
MPALPILHSPHPPRRMASAVPLLLLFLAAGASRAAEAIATASVPANWKARALATVESHRMATLNVEVVDAQGFPLPGAVVSIRQVRSGFNWVVASSDSTHDTAPPGLASNLFNAVSAPPSALARADAWTALASSTTRHGLGLRAAWTGSGPQGVSPVPGTESVEWDLPSDLAPSDLAKAVHRLRQQAPFGRIFLSGADLLGAPKQQPVSALRQLASRLAAQDQGVDGLATVVRLGPEAPTPAEWQARLDEGSNAATGAAPLTWHLTVQPMAGASEGDAARRLSDFLLVAYGHPAVTGVTLRAAEGHPLLGKDGGLSPTGAAWSNLVGVAWSTRIDARASLSGIASARVFRGEHEVSVDLGGSRVATRVVVAADTTARLVTPLVPPTLSAQPGDLLEFTWPSRATGYVLETTATPVEGPWNACETFAVRGRETWRQSHGASSGVRYFRLRRGNSP